MDTHQNFKKWLEKMKYKGEIPTNLEPICNSSTSFVWDQLIHNVKPKQEIEYIRRNILANRLLRNKETCSSSSITSLKTQHEHPMKEIEVWEKKQRLKQQISNARERMSQMRSKTNNLTASNKLKYLHLENLKQKIQQNQRDTFLLNAKCKELETENYNAEEMLTLVCNLTPRKKEDSDNTEILQMLQKCSEKLEKIIEKQESNETLRDNTTLPLLTPYKQPDLLSTTSIKIKYSDVLVQKPEKRESLDDSLGLLGESTIIFDNISKSSTLRDLTVCNNNILVPYDLQILKDEELNGSIECLLRNNRLNIWNIFNESIQNLKVLLMNIIVENELKYSSSSASEINNNEAKLYATHIEYELKLRKIDIKVLNLKRRLLKTQETLFERLTARNPSTLLLEHIKLQQEKTGLTAAVKHSQGLTNSTLKRPTYKNKLKAITEESRRVEENIALKISNMEHKLNAMKQIHETMSLTRNETLMMLRKLQLFTDDPSWISPLTGNVISTKIQTLFEFPLEYNRMIGSNETGMYLRDVPLNHVPYQEDFSILSNPSSYGETLLLGLLKTVERIKRLESLAHQHESVKNFKSELVDVRIHDSQLARILDKLQWRIGGEAAVSRMRRMLRHVHETMEMWLDMPVRKSISNKRLVNDAPYEYYEKIFDNYYNQLP